MLTILAVLVLMAAPALPEPWPGGQAASVSCAEPEGKPLEAPQGLTVCSGTSRLQIRAADEPQDGVRISAVAPGSAAETAGFKAGDTIYRIGGDGVSTGSDVVKRLQALRPGQETVVNFWRDGLPFLIRVRG